MAGCSASLCSSPPYWDLALGFYFLLGIPWKNMGKIKWKIEWKIKSIFMLCICYYYSWRAIIPAISTIGNNVMCPPYINFRSMHHSRLYLEIGPIYNYRRNRRNSQKKKKKRKRKSTVAGFEPAPSKSWTKNSLSFILFYFHLSFFLLFAFLSNFLISLQWTLSVTA